MPFWIPKTWPHIGLKPRHPPDIHLQESIDLSLQDKIEKPTEIFIRSCRRRFRYKNLLSSMSGKLHNFYLNLTSSANVLWKSLWHVCLQVLVCSSKSYWMIICWWVPYFVLLRKSESWSPGFRCHIRAICCLIQLHRFYCLLSRGKLSANRST